MEVCNNTIFQRTNCFDVVMCFFMHLHSFPTHSDHLVGSSVDGYNRRLIYDYSVILYDQGIGCA